MPQKNPISFDVFAKENSDGKAAGFYWKFHEKKFGPIAYHKAYRNHLKKFLDFNRIENSIYNSIKRLKKRPLGFNI